MRPTIKRANEYTDKELKREFNRLKDAGIFKKNACRIFDIHVSTMTSRILRLEDPEGYKARHRKILERRKKFMTEGTSTAIDYFMNPFEQAIRQFKRNLEEKRRQRALMDAADPYHSLFFVNDFLKKMKDDY